MSPEIQADKIQTMADNSYRPKTEIELVNWMKLNCYNPNRYAINGNFIAEGYGIERFGSLFVWFFKERDNLERLKYFLSESEVVEYAFNQIIADKWANSHCIGFTTKLEERDELREILAKMEIKFHQDSIPYFGLERPVYMTHVFGCDILKLEHLKEKYFKKIN